ncbi:MAG: twin-arginine translocase TatA/TatE family subunit [Bacteroidetes bacterium]|nr:twin-arginine translocase TatA/TatE family subunit [Bacteroidota bacterium]
MVLESLFLIGNFGTSEMILIVVAILIFFGGKKIPELMKGIGSGVREFNNAKNNVKSQIEDGMREQPKQEEEKKQ